MGDMLDPSGWTEAAWLTQTSRLGGSIETAETAVAVIPIGLPSTQIEMTFTVAATRRIAWLNASASWGSVSFILRRWGSAARDGNPQAPGKRPVSLGKMGRPRLGSRIAGGAMFDFFLLPGNLPFSVALLVMLMIGAAEAIGLGAGAAHLDAHATPMPRAATCSAGSASAGCRC